MRYRQFPPLLSEYVHFNIATRMIRVNPEWTEEVLKPELQALKEREPRNWEELKRMHPIVHDILALPHQIRKSQA